MSQRYFGYISQPNNVAAYANAAQNASVYPNQGQQANNNANPAQFNIPTAYNHLGSSHQTAGGYSGQYAATPIVVAASSTPKPASAFITAAPQPVAATHSGFISGAYENLYSGNNMTGGYHAQHTSHQPQTASYVSTQHVSSYLPVSCTGSVITSSACNSNTSYTNSYNNPAYHQQVAPHQAVVAAATRPAATSVQPTGNRAMEEALHAAALNVLQTQVVAAGSPAVVGGTPVIRPTAYSAAIAKGLSSMSQQSVVRHPGAGFGFKKNPGVPRNRSNDSFFYCDVCKISCASALTYKDHLQGQKHKKREAATKIGNPLTNDKTNRAKPSGGSHSVQYRCELCDITCTGIDAYQAHIRGKQHKKTERLHQSMGKPIPPTTPVVLGATASSADSTNKALAVQANMVKAGSSVDKNNSFRVSITSLEELHDPLAQPIGQEYVEEEVNSEGKIVNYFCKLCDCHFNDVSAKEMHLKGKRHRLQYKKKVDPTLKVDSRTLPPRERKELQNLEDKLRRRKDNFLQRQALEQTQKELVQLEWATAAISGPHMNQRGLNSMRIMRPPGPMRLLSPTHQPNTSLQDKHVIAKHNSLTPTEEEIESSQSLVAACEEALKVVSFELDVDGDIVCDRAVKSKVNVSSESDSAEEKNEELFLDAQKRALRGTNRVGLLVKHLLLSGDRVIQLVPILANWPTRKIVRSLADRLTIHLTKNEKSYTVEIDETFSKLIVRSNDDVGMECHILPTSLGTRQKTESEKEAALEKISGVGTQSEVVVTPTVAKANIASEASTAKATVAAANPGNQMTESESNGSNDKETVSNDESSILVDQEYCLHALALLRQAKWFQSKVSPHRNCLIIIRLLRNLCQRVPTWHTLSEWAMEILVERSINSMVANLSPSGALRRVFECLAWGILLPGGQGLHDPCEKQITDAAHGLSNQEREDLTASAQHALRLIAFGKIHQVLDMEPLTALNTISNIPPSTTRKRRHSNVRSRTEAEDSDSDDNPEDECSFGAKQESKKPAPEASVVVASQTLEKAEESETVEEEDAELETFLPNATVMSHSPPTN